MGSLRQTLIALCLCAPLVVVVGCGSGGGGGDGGGILPIAALTEPQSPLHPFSGAHSKSIAKAATSASSPTAVTSSGVACGTGAGDLHQFGYSVVAGDVTGDGIADLAVGVPYVEVNGVVDAGKVVVFVGDGSVSCDRIFVLTAPTLRTNGRFGKNLALGDVTGDGISDLAVSADNEGPTDQGIVHLFSFAGAGSFGSLPSVPSPVSSSAFARSVAIGELTGDSAPDLIVGAPAENGLAGAVYVFAGNGVGGFSSFQRLEAPTPTSEAIFGSSLAVGDVTGDGQADLIVGAPGLEPSPVDAGEVFVFPADRVGGFAAPLSLQHPNPQRGDQFGWSVAAVDVTGDGRADLIVGAFRADGGSAAGVPVGQFDAGEVIVFASTGNGAFAAPTIILNPEPQLNARFGYAVGAGDVNGDGLPELVVGARWAPSGGAALAGKVFIFGLNAQGAPVHRYTLVKPNPFYADEFGSALALADITNDGVLDVVAGAEGADVDGKNEAGEVFVFSLAP